jgi:hypothetical protein
VGGNELSFFLKPSVSGPSCAPLERQEMSRVPGLHRVPFSEQSPWVLEMALSLMWLGFQRQAPIRDGGEGVEVWAGTRCPHGAGQAGLGGLGRQNPHAIRSA